MGPVLALVPADMYRSCSSPISISFFIHNPLRTSNAPQRTLQVTNALSQPTHTTTTMSSSRRAASSRRASRERHNDRRLPPLRSSSSRHPRAARREPVGNNRHWEVILHLLARVQDRIRHPPRRFPMEDQRNTVRLHEAILLAYRSRPDVSTAPAGTSHLEALVALERAVRLLIEPRPMWGLVVDALEFLTAEEEDYQRRSRELGAPLPGYYDPAPWGRN